LLKINEKIIVIFFCGARQDSLCIHIQYDIYVSDKAIKSIEQEAVLPPSLIVGRSLIESAAIFLNETSFMMKISFLEMVFLLLGAHRVAAFVSRHYQIRNFRRADRNVKGNAALIKATSTYGADGVDVATARQLGPSVTYHPPLKVMGA
jgi:hypothetical protein